MDKFIESENRNQILNESGITTGGGDYYDKY